MWYLLCHRISCRSIFLPCSWNNGNKIKSNFEVCLEYGQIRNQARLYKLINTRRWHSRCCRHISQGQRFLCVSSYLSNLFSIMRYLHKSVNECWQGGWGTRIKDSKRIKLWVSSTEWGWKQSDHVMRAITIRSNIN